MHPECINHAPHAESGRHLTQPDRTLMPRLLLAALLGLIVVAAATSWPSTILAIPEGDGWAYSYNVVDGDMATWRDPGADATGVRRVSELVRAGR